MFFFKWQLSKILVYLRELQENWWFEYLGSMNFERAQNDFLLQKYAIKTMSANVTIFTFCLYLVTKKSMYTFILFHVNSKLKINVNPNYLSRGPVK